MVIHCSTPTFLKVILFHMCSCECGCNWHVRKAWSGSGYKHMESKIIYFFLFFSLEIFYLTKELLWASWNMNLRWTSYVCSCLYPSMARYKLLFGMLLTRVEFLQLRLNSHGHITGTEYLSDLVEKEHDAHNHGNINFLACYKFIYIFRIQFWFII